MSATKNLLINTFKDMFKFGCLGVIVGLLIIVIAEAQISYQTILDGRQTLLRHFNAGTETQYLLGQAAYAGFKDDYESVISILSPNMNKFTNRTEAAEAYVYLGIAELQLGHPQLAAGYFELTYANKPMSHNLFLLAVSYDQGGNIEKALEKYTLLVSIQDQTTRSDDIAYAQNRIREILTIKGISNPGQ